MNWWKIATPRRPILIFIIGLALYMRFHGIEWGLPNSAHPYSYHPDEGLILRHISYMSPTSLNPHSFINPSLHFYIFGAVYQGMRLTMGIPSLKGRVTPDDQARIILGGRVLTALMGVASVFLLFLIGNRWYGEDAALLAALFLAVLPLHVVHSHFLTVEVPSTFWILMAFFFLTLIEMPGRAAYISGGISSGFAAASKYTGILSVPAFVLGHLFAYRKSGIRVLWEKRIILYLAVAFLAFAFGNPYFFLSPHEVIKDIKALFEINIHATQASYPFGSLLLYGFGTPLLVGFLFGAVTAIYEHRISDIVLLSYTSFVFALVLYSGTPFSRHLVLAAPFMVLIVVRGFSFIFERKIRTGSWKRWMGGIAVLVIAFLFVWTFLSSYGYSSLMAHRDIRDIAAEWISNNIPPGSSLGVAKPWFYSPPLSWSRYNVERIDFSTKQLLLKQPEYFIITDFEYRKKAYIRRFFAPDYTDSERFVELLNNRDLYGVKKIFQVTPGIAGIHFRKGYPPDDWMYVYPTILVLERSTLERHP